MTPVQVAAVNCLSVRRSESLDARNNSRNSFQIDKKALELCAGGKDSYQAPFALEVHNFIVASSAFVFSDINNFAPCFGWSPDKVRKSVADNALLLR